MPVEFDHTTVTGQINLAESIDQFACSNLTEKRERTLSVDEKLRQQLVDVFFQLAYPLIDQQNETPLGDFSRLISFINKNLVSFKRIYHNPVTEAEQQVALWLRDIATLPKSCSIRQKAAPLPVLFGLIPRGYGQPILQSSQSSNFS